MPLKDRVRVVLRAEGLDGTALGALLREEGLTATDLGSWRKLGAATDMAGKASGSGRKRIGELERDLKRKHQALAETAAMLFVEKELKSLVASGAFSGAEADDTEIKTEP